MANRSGNSPPLCDREAASDLLGYPQPDVVRERCREKGEGFRQTTVPGSCGTQRPGSAGSWVWSEQGEWGRGTRWGRAEMGSKHCPSLYRGSQHRRQRHAPLRGAQRKEKRHQLQNARGETAAGSKGKHFPNASVHVLEQLCWQTEGSASSEISGTRLERGLSNLIQF